MCPRVLSQDAGVEDVNQTCGSERIRRPDLSMTMSRQENEEATVSRLLQSLRNETQRCEQLQSELQACTARYRTMWTDN